MTTYTPFRYYSGPMNGWITFYRDDQTGVCWWLDGNQWRFWDNVSQRWLFAHIRTQDKHGNIVVGALVAFLTLSAGAIVGGGPAMAGATVLAILFFVLGLANSRAQNRHPELYQVICVASAVSGAYAIHEMHKRIKNGGR